MGIVNSEFETYGLWLTIHIVTWTWNGVYGIEVATTIPEKVENILKKANVSEVKDILNNSRRIVVGTEALSTRPYMVYLKLPTNNPKYKDYRRWLCGGVIIHEEYILTSAACIEDAKHFYIVSGTYRHDEADDRFTNPCIKNGAKKAIWKCIPRNYVFDGHENDNIRWMNNDIAIVKVEDEFDFTRRVRGCDFIPRPICYNNQSAKLEEPDTIASIAGWGSTERYNDYLNPERAKQNLLETRVQIIPKNNCKKRWGRRYHNIIDNYMICSKDIVPDLTEICSEKYVDCTDVQYSDSDEEGTRRVLNPNQLVLHSAYHNESSRRQGTIGSGGFCENDHGGPLVYGTGANAVVIGIISACLVKENTNRCYGPFLYTSVFRNKVLINCAIYKDATSSCDKLFRSSITHTETDISWADHPDGPAKNEVTIIKQTQEEDLKQQNKLAELKQQQQLEQFEQLQKQKEIQQLQLKQIFLQQQEELKKKQTAEHNRRQFTFNQTTAANVATTAASGQHLFALIQTETINMTTTISTAKYRLDEVQQHSGVVVRSFDNSVKPKPLQVNITSH